VTLIEKPGNPGMVFMSSFPTMLGSFSEIVAEAVALLSVGVAENSSFLGSKLYLIPLFVISSFPLVALMESVFGVGMFVLAEFGGWFF
jgi:hypothetical protein